MSARPIATAYWAEPGRLLAGGYPGSLDEAEARRKLRAILEAGVRLFVDLTEEDEGLQPYAPLLVEEAAGLGVAALHLRRPIADFGVPSEEAMRGTLDAIDASTARGDPVYVHCRGGIGRTGTVVGCFLVRRGLSPEGALAAIARGLEGTTRRGFASPEEECQRAMIRSWPEVEARRDPK
jgi:hypothetical protein